MKAWDSLNSSVADVQQLKLRDAGERKSCGAGRPIAAIEPPSLSASQLPSFPACNRYLL
jgi:hypothetical protein